MEKKPQRERIAFRRPGPNSLASPAAFPRYPSFGKTDIWAIWFHAHYTEFSGKLFTWK